MTSANAKPESKLVVCESTVAITTHLREYEDDSELSYTGHSPRKRALCDAEIAWDTKLPLQAARCMTCRDRGGLGRPAPPRQL